MRYNNTTDWKVGWDLTWGGCQSLPFPRPSLPRLPLLPHQCFTHSLPIHIFAFPLKFSKVVCWSGMLCVIVRYFWLVACSFVDFYSLACLFILLFTHSYVNQAARVNLVIINENDDDDDDDDDLDFFARVWVMAIGRWGLSHVPVSGAKVNANCVSLCYTTICGVICIGADFHRAMVATGPAVRHRACFFVQKSTFVLKKSQKLLLPELHFLTSNMHQIVCRLGLRSRSHWRSLQTP